MVEEGAEEEGAEEEGVVAVVAGFLQFDDDNLSHYHYSETN